MRPEHVVRDESGARRISVRPSAYSPRIMRICQYRTESHRNQPTIGGGGHLLALVLADALLGDREVVCADSATLMRHTRAQTHEERRIEGKISQFHSPLHTASKQETEFNTRIR